MSSQLDGGTPRYIGAHAEDRQSYWRRVDWWLVISAVVLSGGSAVFVWSGSRADLAPANDPQYFLVRHLINALIGVVLALVVSRIDFRLIRAYTPVIYVVAVLSILVVFTPLGTTIAGARAWVSLPGGFTLQTSELAKVAIILVMALILAEKRDAEDGPRDRDVFLALVLAAVPIGLVLLQNDTGTALVMVIVVVTIVAVSGARRIWIVGLIGGGIAAALLALQVGLIQDYQVARLTSFLSPEGAEDAAGYNAAQARIAIGGGGIFGRGLFQGPQTQGNFVPVNESDFIFTVIAEEAGFLGAILCLALLGVVLWRGLRIAAGADDLFGRLVATGVVAWIGFQAFENLGMAMGIMPITGVPLPFVSYGGSSMFASWIALGLLVNVQVHTAANPSSGRT